MAGTVPLISSGVAGPLGVVHLPRLWSKVLLSAKGQLHEEYDECGPGFDQMVLDGLKLDREATLRFLKEHLPTYPQFEHWVLAQKGGRVSDDELAAVNAAIRGYEPSDATRQRILAAAGMKDTGRFKDGVMLNNLEDWTEFHAALTSA